jgi:hypothetical protein
MLPSLAYQCLAWFLVLIKSPLTDELVCVSNNYVLSLLFIVFDLGTRRLVNKGMSYVYVFIPIERAASHITAMDFKFSTLQFVTVTKLLN